jgi:hypothetical protein
MQDTILVHALQHGNGSYAGKTLCSHCLKQVQVRACAVHLGSQFNRPRTHWRSGTADTSCAQWHTTHALSGGAALFARRRVHEMQRHRKTGELSVEQQVAIHRQLYAPYSTRRVDALEAIKDCFQTRYMERTSLPQQHREMTFSSSMRLYLGPTNNQITATFESKHQSIERIARAAS